MVFGAGAEAPVRGPLCLRPLRSRLPNALGGGHVAAVLLPALTHARSRHHRGARHVVDDLRVDVRHTAEYRQARPRRGPRQLAPDAFVDATADFFLFRLFDHLALAPVLPTFLRSVSPVYRTPLFL